jgi:imidazolonepropionase-like amidohydrolase
MTRDHKGRTAIIGALIVTGTSAPLIDDGVLLLEGARIAAVGRRADFPHFGEGDHVIEAHGQTVLPGFIDTHVHIFHEAQLLKLSESAAALWGANYVQSALRAGLTTIRDLGAQTPAVFGLRRAIRDGYAAGPRVLACGSGICMTGGHGWANLSSEADGPDGVRRLARQQLKAGADVIKLMASGGAGTPGELPTSVQLSLEELRAGVEEAHKAGKPAAAHALATQSIINAIEAGVDSVEHGVFLDDRCIELMLKRDVALCPTISVYPRIVERGKAGGEGGFVIEKSVGLIEPHFASLKRAVSAGVKIVYGTDSATLYNPLGDGEAEMSLMVKAGMSPLAVIASATRLAAQLCGIGNEVGTLEAGKLADVLIVRGDASRDIDALRHVEMVLRNGVEVHRHGEGRASPGLVARPILERA